MEEEREEGVQSDTGPFCMIPEWVLYHPDLTATAIRVYGVFARYADYEDGTSFPSRKTVAKKAQCSARTLDGAVRDLIKVKALQRAYRLTDKGSWTSNLWTVVRANSATPSANSSGTPPADNDPTPSAESAPLTRTSVKQEPVELETLEAKRLAHLMADLIQERGNKRPSVSAKWIKDMSSLIRLDGRTPGEIEKVLRWLNEAETETSEFWKINILSPFKLRAKWDRMREQHLREEQTKKKGTMDNAQNLIRKMSTG